MYELLLHFNDIKMSCFNKSFQSAQTIFNLYYDDVIIYISIFELLLELPYTHIITHISICNDAKLNKPKNRIRISSL